MRTKDWYDILLHDIFLHSRSIFIFFKSLGEKNEDEKKMTLKLFQNV